jgi:nucleotide-binding universal stress UspA family protein
MYALQSIVHPTDFSEASADAFFHALRIALAAKATLTILHVSAEARTDEWASFPHVRKTLADWGLMDANESTDAIHARTGMKVIKVAMMPQQPVEAILHFLHEHPAGLVVVATQARQGVARWLHGSVAEDIARHVDVPTLFVPAQARGFVDPARGEVHLRHVLMPVDHEPAPGEAVSTAMGFAQMIAGIAAETRLLHVGDTPPAIQAFGQTQPPPVAHRKGDVLTTLLDAAKEWPADLIAMATAGHQGFMDALRGSTTEQIVRQAPCPVLAVPLPR